MRGPASLPPLWASPYSYCRHMLEDGFIQRPEYCAQKRQVLFQPRNVSYRASCDEAKNKQSITLQFPNKRTNNCSAITI